MFTILPDTGTSQHIINGDIKIKHGSAIRSFTENGISFADGTELQADIIIFATGYDIYFIPSSKDEDSSNAQLWWSPRFYA
jgi:NADH dehydrogenase FAD-containing subunit